MIELELSTIPDSDLDLQVLTRLVNEFADSNQVRVRISTMTWSDAWTDLLTIASHGRGPHISHIGGSWTSSLIMMNALRPFQSSELEKLGGASAFMQPTWLSTCLHGEQKSYAIPWTGYIYVICYRRDMLKQAGIEEATAFGSIEALGATIKKLSQSSLEIPWLNPPIVAPYNDYLHMAASWVWGSGGQFIDDSGTKLVFDSDSTIRGVTAWLETHLSVRPEHAEIDTIAGLELFAQGKVAAILTDIRNADSFFARENLPFALEDMGVATLTEVPWCGGGSFVIWNHTRGEPEHEKAAVALVQFLNSKENQLLWANVVKSMSARLDTLEEIYQPGHPLREAVMLAANRGLPYMSVPLWRRVEHQLAMALGGILDEARQNPTKEPSQIVRDSLEPLARRLNLAFSG
jgi:multiple sugar transport system substrate-binding protein